MALVSTGRVLMGFINKPGPVRDPDGRRPKRLLHTHYKKKREMFGDFFTYLSFIIPRSLYYLFPMSNTITFNLTVSAFSGETQ